MPYGLPDGTLVMISRVLASHPAVTEAVIFGSRAKGNFKPGSDIDLTLKGEGLDLRQLNKISLELDDLLLPYTFDLSLYAHLTDPDFLDHIRRVGLVLYRRDPDEQ